MNRLDVSDSGDVALMTAKGMVQHVVIPAALLARHKEAAEAVTSAKAARNSLEDVLEMLRSSMAKADEAESDAEAAEERVTHEIRRLLAEVPGASVDGGCADLDTDKAGRLTLCMTDGRDLPVVGE